MSLIVNDEGKGVVWLDIPLRSMVARCQLIFDVD